MKLIITAILASLAAAHVETQTIVTWTSTSTASLDEISTWRSVNYGPSPVTPIPTVYARPPPPDLTIWVRERTASRNINITRWSTVYVTPSAVKTETVTAYTTAIGIPTVYMEGTGTSTSYVTSTAATIHFTPTVCANSDDGTLPKTTVTRYTGTYTPFPGQVVTTTARSFPTVVTSYVEVISNRRIFPYTGTTVFYTSTTTESNFPSTTTRTTTSTSFYSNPLIGTIYNWSTYATTSITFWAFASAVHPMSTPCSADKVTVTYAMQCAPSNIISSRDDRAVTISWKQDTHKWTTQGPNFNSDLMREAFHSPSVCCQLCMDNAREGCAASEWTGSWNEGCKLWFYGGSAGRDNNKTCEEELEELEYFADENRFAGQRSFLSGGACGRLRYIGLKNGGW